MNRRLKAVVLGLWALGACKKDEPAEPVRTQAAAVPADPNAEAVAASADDSQLDRSKARPERCVDWSKEDLSDLPPLPASEHGAMLDRVWRRVLEKHYDPTLGCVDWLAVRSTYGKKLAEAKDTQAAFAVINEMLGELEQSHFRLFEPAGSEGDVGPAAPRLQVRWIDAGLVVVEAEPGGGADDVPLGARLHSVQGVRVDQLAAEAKKRAGAEGGSTFAFEVARGAMARLSCARVGETRTLEVEPADSTQAPRAIEVTCQEPKGELVSLGNLRHVPTHVTHRMIEESQVGYLAFNIWMLPMVARVKDAMADLREQGMKALVIDLRGNPGGVGPMSVPVARMLLSQPGSLGKLKFRDFTQEFNVEPSDDPFTGPVVLLIDEGTASTSEIFAAGLRDLGRVEIAGGRSSAGAALPSVIEELDEGVVLQYVVGDYHSPKGTLLEGRGVVPDIVVPESRAAFAAGRDPVLEAGVQHLKKRLGT